MNILIVGLGVIGGSIAKALKRSTGHKIYAIDTNEDTLLDAVSAGAIDSKAVVYDMGKMDLIYLCLYPDDCLEFMRSNGKYVKKGSIVTDTCGVKTLLCEHIPEMAEKYDFSFVAGHPMAGKEKSGFSESDPSIFSGASYIIVETEYLEKSGGKEAEDIVINLAKDMGFANIVRTTPEKHDDMIAFTSQVPHVLACAYVLSPLCKNHKGFSAGSYRDVSRVADINAELWTRLFLDNRMPLAKELDTLISNIAGIKDAVEKNDETQLKELLKKAAQVKRSDNI